MSATTDKADAFLAGIEEGRLREREETIKELAAWAADIEKSHQPGAIFLPSPEHWMAETLIRFAKQLETKE
jgi:hypothetical protein